jgi:hypothetical protein
MASIMGPVGSLGFGEKEKTAPPSEMRRARDYVTF